MTLRFVYYHVPRLSLPVMQASFKDRLPYPFWEQCSNTLLSFVVWHTSASYVAVDIHEF